MGLIGTEHFLEKFSPKGLVLDFDFLRATSPSSGVIKGGNMLGFIYGNFKDTEQSFKKVSRLAPCDGI